MTCIQDQQKQFIYELFLLSLVPKTVYSGDELCPVNTPFRYSNLFHKRPQLSLILDWVLAKQHQLFRLSVRVRES
jgi:hypothetical protein